MTMDWRQQTFLNPNRLHWILAWTGLLDAGAFLIWIGGRIQAKLGSGTKRLRDLIHPKKNVYYRNQEGILTNSSGWTKGFTANTIKLVRYADVLLLAAECEVELGNLEQARTYINVVRRRAANPVGWVTDSSGAPAARYVVQPYPQPFPDPVFARKAVRHERRIELGMEGHRFFDLVRWGIAAAEKQRYFETEQNKRPFLRTAQFVQGKDEYWPIPQKAIEYSWKDGGPTLKQNPGY